MCSRLSWLLFAITLGLNALAACGDETTAPPDGHARPAVDSILTATRTASGVPGIVAAVIRSDRIEAVGASGVRRLGAQGQVTADDRFHLGSNVKAMTATLLAMLVEEGTLDWGTTALEAFPELAGTIHPEHAGVTLTQLLQHRAGIEPLTNFAEVPPLPGTPRQQRRLGSGMLLELPPAAPVGTYLYSNGGYGIAAAMAEARTERPWEDLLQSRLLQPLGIAATFGWPAAADPSQPWGHEPTASGWVPHAPDLTTDPLRMPPAIAPAGDLSMSVRDYAKFIQLHLRGLRGQPRLLSGETFARLHTPVEHYAMGWGEVDLEGERTATHDGSTGTFWATVWMQPGRDLAVAVLVNAGGERAAAAAGSAAAALLRRYGGVAPAGAVAAARAGR
jgi:CubicO group peptidase (beta-lactamase class C family)